MTTYTSTHTSPPTCENCGRDKQATYICDACCAKLNAATRKLTAERDELQRRINELLAILEPGPEPNCMDPQYNPSKRVSIYDVVRMWHEHRSSIHARALEIAGRTE